MNRATTQMRNFALRLMDYERAENNPAGLRTPAGFQVNNKLRRHLATFMGQGGFKTLQARSLALATAEVAWLGAVQVKADGTLEEVETLQTQLAPDQFLEGRVVLLAHLLGLLVLFVGENLTLRLVREVWPKVPLHGLDFGKGEQYEKSR